VTSALTARLLRRGGRPPGRAGTGLVHLAARLDAGAARLVLPERLLVRGAAVEAALRPPRPLAVAPPIERDADHP